MVCDSSSSLCGVFFGTCSFRSSARNRRAQHKPHRSAGEFAGLAVAQQNAAKRRDCNGGMGFSFSFSFHPRILTVVRKRTLAREWLLLGKQRDAWSDRSRTRADHVRFRDSSVAGQRAGICFDSRPRDHHVELIVLPCAQRKKYPAAPRQGLSKVNQVHGFSFPLRPIICLHGDCFTQRAALSGSRKQVRNTRPRRATFWKSLA